MRDSTEKMVGKSHLVKKSVGPANVDNDLKETQKQATHNWIIRIYYKIRGYAAEDITKLKKVGIEMVEYKSLKEGAEAIKVISEAEKNFAEAESKRVETAIKEARAQKENVDLTEKMAQNAERIADATERVEKAISKIKQQGGNVFFDIVQLKALIKSGRVSFPKDENIKKAADEVEGESE